MARRGQSFEPMESQIGQDTNPEIVTDHNGNAEIVGDEVVTAREIDLKSEKLELLKFMNEMVTVDIHETAEENADQVFSIGVNGRYEHFRRGERKTVKRYYVEGLARAKPVGYRYEEFVKPDGSRAIRYPSRTGLRYGFSVAEDTPKGRAWLAEVLRQP